MQLSHWEREQYFKNIDITIIGSGIVGLSTALSLLRKQPKLKVLILERGILPLGASSKNAGFACFGSPSEILDDLKTHSENEVINLISRRWKGLQRLRKNLGDKNIDFHNWGGYELFESTSEFERCEQELNRLNSMAFKATGIKQVYVANNKKNQKYGFHHFNYLIENRGEGQIDTGKMIVSLLRLVQQKKGLILNGVEVKNIDTNGTRAEIMLNDNFKFSSKQVIITTNGFAQQLLPGYPVHPARAQVLITKPIAGLKIKGTFHFDKGYYYFRNINNRILFGGGRNLDFKTEETVDFGLTKLVQNKLDVLLKENILPNYKYEVEHRWSGIMGVGPQKVPIIKRINKNLICAIRMGGMGVAIGSLVGEDAANLALEEI